MASLCMVNLGSPVVPTVLGMLVLGKQPVRYLPMAYVSFLRLAGKELATEVVSSHEMSGPLPRLMAQLWHATATHLWNSASIPAR